MHDFDTVCSSVCSKFMMTESQTPLIFSDLYQSFFFTNSANNSNTPIGKELSAVYTHRDIVHVVHDLVHDIQWK